MHFSNVYIYSYFNIYYDLGSNKEGFKVFPVNMDGVPGLRDQIHLSEYFLTLA